MSCEQSWKVTLPLILTLPLIQLCAQTGTPGVGGLKEILTQRYRQFGGLVREKVAGRTRVHVFDPEHVQSVYKQEGKWPQIEPLVETTQLYRQQAQHSPGLGNT